MARTVATLPAGSRITDYISLGVIARFFPVEKVHAIASRKSIGLEVSFGDRILKCEDVEQFDFSTVDLVLMSVSGAFSKEWSPRIGALGPIVIMLSCCQIIKMPRCQDVKGVRYVTRLIKLRLYCG